ncbi:MAG: hypothetical protein C4313_04635 [Thermoflexus sp.]|uniref:hypothetical protein n=1 Tax=Thermoflexus sp. TaxID=1969742 RepID=UPI00331E57B6
MSAYWWQGGQAGKRSPRRRRPSKPPAPLSFALTPPAEAERAVETYRVGDLCPNCEFARLEYDGYFNVYCPVCGFRAGAHGACT